ncbi:MAG TPA: hypothetical protein VNU26_17610 [Mycobacteriales bacterium]|nr:hypothetical protein [Mycobacteriales bacterium]
MAKTSKTPPRRPTRAGVSIEARQVKNGSTRYYARFTDRHGRRCVVPPPEGGKTWSDWGQAFAAACAQQSEAERLSYRSRGGETLLFRDLVADHYLPPIKDAAPNTRKNTASHLGDGSAVPARKRALRSTRRAQSTAVAYGHRAIGAIGQNEVAAVDQPDGRQARSTRALPDESTTAPTRALRVSQRGLLTIDIRYITFRA